MGDRARAAVATPRAPGRARRGAGILRRMLAACARGRVAVVAAAVLATAGWVRPHTELKATDPKADGVLDASPAAVTLTYTTVVRLALSTVTVRSAGEDGARVAGRLAYLADDRRDVLVLPLDEPLPPGSYTVAWTTAGPDGHRISGEFGFRVEPPAAGGEVAAEQGEPPAPPDDGGAGTARPQAGDSGAGQVLVPMVVRFLFHGGIAGVVGAVTFRLLVLGQCARSGESGAVIEAAAKRAGTLAVLSLGLLLATLPMRLWHQAGTFFPRDAAGNLLAVLHGSAWAAGWWLQLGAVLVLAGGAVHLRRGGAAAGGWAGVALGALLLPFVPVLSGHGWADTPRAVSAAATYLHVVAAGAWMGGLACLLLAGLPGIRGHGGGGAAGAAALSGMVNAFSRVARVAVALLFVTGAARVWTHVDAVSDLWTTEWGTALLGKQAVVAGVLILGFCNWRFVRPALAGNPRPGPIRLLSTIELLLGAWVVWVTSYLVAQPLG